MIKSKRILFIFISTLVFQACSDFDPPNYTYKFLPIESAESPASFTYGKIDSITVTYFLPNGCHSFKDIYYEYQDTTRIVAAIAFVQLDQACTEILRKETYTFPVEATQREAYVFKFWKGEDTSGNAIFEEVIIPVN